MGKFLKTLVSSAAVGAAVGYFLTTKKGRELKEKAVDFANDYKENPEAYNQAAKERPTNTRIWLSTPSMIIRKNLRLVN